MTTQGTNPNRVPAGVTTGGQYAHGTKADSDVSLAGPPATSPVMNPGDPVMFRNRLGAGPTWLSGTVLPTPEDAGGKAVWIAGDMGQTYLLAPEDIETDIDPYDYDGDDVDGHAARWGWSSKDWELYYDGRQERELVEAEARGAASVTDPVEHPGGGVSVHSYIGDDGAKVYQLDTEGDGDHVRVHLNDSTLYDGRVGVDENPGKAISEQVRTSDVTTNWTCPQCSHQIQVALGQVAREGYPVCPMCADQMTLDQSRVDVHGDTHVPVENVSTSWTCPGCDTVQDVSLNSLAESGTPYCPQCDEDMELSDNQPVIVSGLRAPARPSMVLKPEEAAEQILANYPDFERQDGETERDITEIKMARALADLQHYAQSNGIDFTNIVNRANDVFEEDA